MQVIVGGCVWRRVSVIARGQSFVSIAGPHAAPAAIQKTGSRPPSNVSGALADERTRWRNLRPYAAALILSRKNAWFSVIRSSGQVSGSHLSDCVEIAGSRL
jgi:hypothetical protein